MSVIRPFRAIRYTARDLAALLAPPYDVLTADDKATLLRRDRRNFVAVDLPHVPPKSAGPDSAYQDAARTIDTWLADGTLQRDPLPAIYVYHQRYQHDGERFLRRMFFARLRLEPFGSGSVFPHEQTFGGPKEDRLALTRAARANLSPIFGLYEDPGNAVAGMLAAQIGSEPIAHGTLDGVDNRLWALTDPHAIADVQRLLADRPTFIADGHHRYGTALLYRDAFAREHGQPPPEHPIHYVLCVFCAMDDPGLLILPTHRVLHEARGFTAARLAGDAMLRVDPLPVASADACVHELARRGPQAVGFWSAGERAFFAVQPADPGILDPLEPQRSPAWRRLGLAFLHRYLIDEVMAKRLGVQSGISYLKSAADAVSAAAAAEACAFLLQPTKMSELRAVCQAGDLMPQKSTYFYPKLASGLLINPLAD